jgi:predicted naringenin-chalcone synthase
MALEIVGWGSAVPPGKVEQSQAASHAVEIWGEMAGLGTTVPALYRRSGVKSRHSVVVEGVSEGGGVHQSFYHVAQSTEDRGPSTQARLEFFEREASGLGLASSKEALADAGVSADEITHVVTVSCSGFEAPGFDIHLVEELGLRRDVARTHVGFMGCHGAFNALRVANAFGATDPNARILICCVELCSLHQQYSSDAQQIVANALFSDGSAALVARAPDEDSAGWKVVAQSSFIVPETRDQMSWRIKDHGFQMTLSPKVPDLIQEHLAKWLAQWLDRQGRSLSDIRSWAVHPGGPRILTACATALALPEGALDISRGILAEYGNMSSPTILFILNRLRLTKARLPCVALAFGPGLTIEAALVDSGP